MTKSLCAVAPAGDSAAVAPFDKLGYLIGIQVKILTLLPVSSNRVAIAVPMMPAPTTATFEVLLINLLP